MSTVGVRADKGSLTRFLGWFSIGLGTAQLIAPRLLCRAVGADPEGNSPLVMRLMGVRELAHGGGMLASRRPAPWIWSRVGGDALDLALLGVVLARNGRARTALAIANVMAVAAPDITESIRLARRRNVSEPGKRIRKASRWAGRAPRSRPRGSAPSSSAGRSKRPTPRSASPTRPATAAPSSPSNGSTRLRPTTSGGSPRRSAAATLRPSSPTTSAASSSSSRRGRSRAPTRRPAVICSPTT